MASALSEADLKELEKAPDEIGLRMEQDRTGRAWIEPDAAARKALAALPRLVSEVRRLRERVAEAEGQRERLEKQSRGSREEGAGGKKRAAPQPAEDLASLLSAPFRVSPRTAAAAKDDPLAALAVQVARSLAEDASDVERARLIAMAFAASQGDMEAFWQARRQRSVAKLAGLAGR